MKKAVAFLLILLISASIYGCGRSSQHNPGNTLDSDSSTLNGFGETGEDLDLIDPDKGGLNGETISGSGGSSDGQMQDNNNMSESDSLLPNGNDADNSPSTGDNSADDNVALEVCNHCQQSGHEIENCPNKICNYCKLSGHLIDDCSAKKWDEKYCDYCGVRGHARDNCPRKKEHDSFCTYCNMDGHSVDNCLDRIMAEDICSFCGLSGKVHDKNVCAATPCSYCGETGHWDTDCVLKANDERNYCAYCKVYGHKRSTCEKEAADFAAFDINYWVQYAKDYAVSIGLGLEPTMTKDGSCWDTPIPASYRGKYIKRDVEGRLEYYKACIEKYNILGIVWIEALPDGPYEWDLMVYYG